MMELGGARGRALRLSLELGLNDVKRTIRTEHIPPARIVQSKSAAAGRASWQQKVTETSLNLTRLAESPHQ